MYALVAAVANQDGTYRVLSVNNNKDYLEGKRACDEMVIEISPECEFVESLL